MKSKLKKETCERIIKILASPESYQDFCLKLSEDCINRFQLILDYEDFQVWEDTFHNKYYYVEVSENDASDFFEVNEIAKMTFCRELLGDGAALSQLFECYCCGKIHNKSQYVWFERRSKECV